MDQPTQETVRRLLAERRLDRLALEDELCSRLGIGWSRAAVALQWMIEDEVIVQDEEGSLRLATAADARASPRSR